MNKQIKTKADWWRANFRTTRRGCKLKAHSEF